MSLLKRQVQFGVASAVGFWGMSSIALANGLIDACKSELRPNKVALVSNEFAKLAELHVLQDSTRSTKSTNASLDIPDELKAVYGTNEEQQVFLSKYDKVQWTQDDYVGYIASYVPLAGYAGFNDCVEKVLKVPGVYLKIRHADATSAIIELHFVPVEGARGDFKLSLVTTNAKDFDTPHLTVPASGYNQLITLLKSDVFQKTTLKVNVDKGPTAPPGDYVSIPPFYHTVSRKTETPVTLIDPKVVQCGGEGGPGATVVGPDYGPPPAGPDTTYENPVVRLENWSSWREGLPSPKAPNATFSLSADKKRLSAHTICTPYNGSLHYWMRTSLQFTKLVVSVETIGPDGKAVQ